MSDLISREAAVHILCEENINRPLDSDRWLISDIYKKIEELPTIERKKGKWKETDDGWDGTYYVCSECGCPWTLIDGDPEDNGMNYCPNCGADMRGGKDD